jgi:hypothetical protein
MVVTRWSAASRSANASRAWPSSSSRWARCARHRQSSGASDGAIDQAMRELAIVAEQELRRRRVVPRVATAGELAQP